LKTRLAAHGEVDYIVGTAPTAEAAMAAKDVSNRGIQVIAYYYSPKLRKSIRCGQIAAAAYDNPGAQARVAVDLAVKALNGEEADWNVGPKVKLLNADNLTDVLGPDPSDNSACE